MAKKKRVTSGAPTKKATSGARKKKKRSVTVTLSDSHLPRIKGVAKKLRAKGMKVDSILEKTGQITGSYSKPPSKLKAVDGVLEAEEETAFQIPPPDSDVQ